MASPSKEERVLKLILENSPLKHWHFEEFVKNTKMTRASVNKWLKKYQKEGLIKRIKERGKFPYITVGSNNPIYISKKKLYMLNKFYEVGLMSYLTGLNDSQTIIIFGSMARGDWYKDSDIDIFIFGKTKKIEKHKYELKLKRDIELHLFKSKSDLKNIKTGLIQNIANGYVVKGLIQDFAKVNG